MATQIVTLRLLLLSHYSKSKPPPPSTSPLSLSSHHRRRRSLRPLTLAAAAITGGAVGVSGNHYHHHDEHRSQLVEAFHYNAELKTLVAELSAATAAVEILHRDGDWISGKLWAAVRYLIETNRVQEALQVFDVWKNKETSRINNANYSKIIRLLVEECLMHEAASTFANMEKHGLAASLGVYNDMIHGFAKEKDFDSSRALLSKMVEAGVFPTTETFNGLIRAYGNHKMYDEMSKCVKKMESEGCRPNEVTYNILIGEFAQARLLERMEAVYRTLLSKKMNAQIPTMLAMLEAYADLGIVEKMEKVYRKVLKSKAYLKESLIRKLATVYIENYRFARLEVLGNDIASISGRTDLVWCIFLLSSACLSSRKGIESIVRHMEIGQANPNVTFGNILALFYAKMKEFRKLDSLLVQNSMRNVKPDIVTFGILFDACQVGFDGTNVLEVWRRCGFLEEVVEIKTDPLVLTAFGKGCFIRKSEKLYMSLGPKAKAKQQWTYGDLIQLVFNRKMKIGVNS